MTDTTLTTRPEHWTVLVYTNGTYLGRLTPNGGTNRLSIYASMLTRERAEEIASEINAGVNVTDEAKKSTITAKARKF